MQPLDTDMQYMQYTPRPATPASRLSILYIFPLLGLLLILLFIGAAFFQWDLSVLVDNLIVFMVVLFFVFIGIVFWAVGTPSNETRG